MLGPVGIYIHVPFCASKCPYCDFYSLTGQEDSVLDDYTGAVMRSLSSWHERLPGVSADTLYLGGGTPSLLGEKRIEKIIGAAKRYFGLEGAEITMEANPGDRLDRVFPGFALAGGNRVSIGVQSFDRAQLRVLGRRHTPEDAQVAVLAALSAGIDNISVDFMLGLPGETAGQKGRIENFGLEALRLGAKHISAYILKIEENTPFYSQRDKLLLPDEDMTAEIYLAACDAIEALGYRQYEISNFAMPGYESRHNLKYWNLDPYLGIGPAAHSHIDGRRFYYPADLKRFISGCDPVPEGGDSVIKESGEQEYIMLRLRLAEGVTNQGFIEKFGHPIPKEVYQRASRLPAGLLTVDAKGIRLTKSGFLLSNTIIAGLLDC